MTNPSFWGGKRVLVTGHTGFKGGWLSLWLHHLGAEVSGYALPPSTQPNLYDAVALDDLVASEMGDIRDLGHIRRTLDRTRPEVIFHLAAQPLVRHSYDDPVETYAVNVMGTVNLLQAARECESVRAVVIVTSDKCYENREWVWGYRESDPMGGYDPYSSSKGCAELVTAAFRRSYFDNGSSSAGIASVRAGNVIGGGDWAADRLVPDIIRALDTADPVVLRSPNAIRPWQHVLEPLGGYLLLAERLWEDPTSFGTGWNFGPKENAAIPVLELAERIVELRGTGEIRIDGGPHPHEATFLSLDTSQARRLLGWQPRLDLASTLQLTVAWYEAFSRSDDVRTLTLEQIGYYEHERHAAAKPTPVK